MAMICKKALLIASPYGGLRGPLNDVIRVREVLDIRGFTSFECCGDHATRHGILQAWQQLIDDISEGDVVVIYYSGHGGLVELPRDQNQAPKSLDHAVPWRYQFLVPMDFKQTTTSDFRGILDIELVGLLWNTTNKTRNVTVIFDCCHAGRMVRDPGFGDEAVAKALFGIQYHDISAHVNHLRSLEEFQHGAHIEENPFAVCIAAAAPGETAWEYRNANGEWCGVMTEALVHTIAESQNYRVPWCTTLLRVSERVGARFPSQHPNVSGCRNRFHFSSEENKLETFHIRQEGENVVIQAGRISGIHEGNTYSVWPLGTENANSRETLAEACVISVNAFKAVVNLTYDSSNSRSLPAEGATALLKEEALNKWPVVLPPETSWLETMVREARLIRPAEVEDANSVFAEILQESERIFLRQKGLEIISVDLHPSTEDQISFVESVERLARAQYFLALKHEEMDEILEHQVIIEFAVLGDNLSSSRIIRQDGTDSVTENDRIYIRFDNRGPEIVYAWVFDINTAGKISRVSRSSGVELPPGREQIVGASTSGLVIKGLPVTWPKDLPRTSSIKETLMIVLVDSPLDLNHIADPMRLLGRKSLSKFEQLMWRISSNDFRLGTIVDDNPIRYDVMYINFLLRSNSV